MTKPPTSRIYADEIVTGCRIIPAGRTMPVTITAQLDNGGTDRFEFFGETRNGNCALSFHRSEQVELVLNG